MTRDRDPRAMQERMLAGDLYLADDAAVVSSCCPG